MTTRLRLAFVLSFDIRHLRYVPGVAGAEEFVEVAFAALVDCLLDLVVDPRFVLRPLNAAEDAERFRGALFITHPAEQVVETGLWRFFVVEQEVVFGDTFAEL